MYIQTYIYMKTQCCLKYLVIDFLFENDVRYYPYLWKLLIEKKKNTEIYKLLIVCDARAAILVRVSNLKDGQPNFGISI